MKYRISYSFLEPERFTGVKSLLIKDGIVTVGGTTEPIVNSIGRDGKIYIYDKTHVHSDQTPVHSDQTHVHSDWINDLMFVNGTCNFYKLIVVVTCSSDLTVKVTVGSDINTLGNHSDSVMALSVLHSHKIASAGLDKKIRFWDLNASKMTSEIVLMSSVYAISSSRSIIAAATSLGNAVKLYDTRSNDLILELNGHNDMYNSGDGQHLISGGSDCTVNYWDFAMPKRPLHSINHYNDSIWKIVSKDVDFNTFWVGTKSGYLWKTWRNSSCQSHSVCIGQEASGITALDGIEGGLVWTGSFDLSCWTDIPASTFPISLCDEPTIQRAFLFLDPDDDSAHTKSTNDGNNDVNSGKLPLYEYPQQRIKGDTRIIRAVILNNKRWVLAENSDHALLLVDIIACDVIRKFDSNSNFDDVLSQINPKEWISNWCSLETKTGILTIHIFEGNCYDAEAYLDDLKVSNLNEENANGRVNLALWILTYLFLGYIKSEKESTKTIPILNDSSRSSATCMTYSTPSIVPHGSPVSTSNHSLSPIKNHSKSISYKSFSFIETKDSPWLILPLSVSLRIGIQETAEVSGYLDLFSSTPLSLLENQSSIEALKKVMPDFLSDWLLQNTTPAREVSKINFTLDPLPNSKINSLPSGNNRLNCTRMTRLCKISEYIDGRIPKEAALQTRLYLNNELLDPKLTVSTVKYFYFKNSGPLVLHYKRIKQESE